MESLTIVVLTQLDYYIPWFPPVERVTGYGVNNALGDVPKRIAQFPIPRRLLRIH